MLTTLDVDGTTTYSEITIAPVDTVKDGQSIDLWLAETCALGLTDGMVVRTESESGVIIEALEPDDGMYYLEIIFNYELTNESYVFYTAQDATDGGTTRTKGWYTGTSEAMEDWVEMTTPVTVQFNSDIFVIQGSADTAFGKINGYVVGTAQS